MSSDTAGLPDIQITVHWLESSRAQRLLVLLEELHLPYTFKTYKRNANASAPESLKKVHPLGKSPAVEIQLPGQAPFVLVESGAIFEYLCYHFGKRLLPERNEGHKVGVESEEFRRNRYFMHYAEGSMMSLLAIAAVFSSLKNAPLPFFLKPFPRMIANKVDEAYLHPNFATHFAFLEDQLKTSSGKYLCGQTITEADFMMMFPVEFCKSVAGLTKEKAPFLWEWLEGMKRRESYRVAERKVIEIEGCFKAVP